MLTIILSSVFQEEPQNFDDGLTLVGNGETVDECKEKIQSHFDEEFNEEFYLDWSRFEDEEVVEVMIKDGFGDNDMMELGYVIL